ncbi:regulatory protein RecX, partial [Paracraurococcus ruber]
MAEESRPPRKPRERPRRVPRPAGPPPGEAALREAALAHLARFAATEAGLTRVLRRRVDRWA